MFRKPEYQHIHEVVEWLSKMPVRNAHFDGFSVESLKKSNFPLKLSQMASAIANSGGGIIILGAIIKGKKIIGANAISTSLLQSIKFELNTLLSPYLSEMECVEFEKEEGKSIAYIFIPNSYIKPFIAIDYHYYHRSNTQTLLMEEHHIRLQFNAAASADLEIAGIINTHGIPLYKDSVPEIINFYPKVLIRNVGNAPASLYKIEISVPSDFYDSNFLPFQNYFNRLENQYSVFSFPHKSPVFQGETIAVCEAKFFVNFQNIKTFMRQKMEVKLFSLHGVKEYSFMLNELFTWENREINAQVFSNINLFNHQ